jgi:hypothetical protein
VTLDERTLEPRLSRLYGAFVLGALIFLTVGLFFHPLLWVGAALLVVAPLSAAGIAWLAAAAIGDRAMQLSITAAALGVGLAVVIGLLLTRAR